MPLGMKKENSAPYVEKGGGSPPKKEKKRVGPREKGPLGGGKGESHCGGGSMAVGGVCDEKKKKK